MSHWDPYLRRWIVCIPSGDVGTEIQILRLWEVGIARRRVAAAAGSRCGGMRMLPEVIYAHTVFAGVSIFSSGV